MFNFKRLCFVALLPLSIALSGCSVGDEPSIALEKKPNILLIVVDDMGMADLGSFGSEIETPNLDKLAHKGIRFTNFHSAPVCSVTRAMLLTGVDSHKAGLGNMAEEMAPNQKGKPGYEGEINKSVVTIASLLKGEGYSTFLSGKWHLGMSLETSPWANGFDRSFALLSGGASHYADMLPAYHPDPNANAPYREDKEILQDLPENFEYSTQFYVDQMIDYVEGAIDEDKPFFAYLAFSAPHWPLQAPEAAVAKYKGRYTAGFDELRRERLARQIEMGIVPENSKENNPYKTSVPWTSLTPEEQAVEARAMEIYAGMVDEIDVHTGRLLDYLNENDELEDTIVIFMSDNGAEGHNLDQTWDPVLYPEIRRNIDTRHDFSFENMGKPKSYVLYGPNWARASAPSLSLYKGYPTEGGIRVPAFISFDGFLSGEISNRFFTVRDIVPTLIELLQIQHPAGQVGHEGIEKPTGVSMIGPLTDENLLHQASEQVYGGEVMGRYFIQKGEWKMVHLGSLHGHDDWRLFNIVSDPGEQMNLAKDRPEIVENLETEWKNYASENGVILPDWVSGY